jgi:hypothetical protein
MRKWVRYMPDGQRLDVRREPQTWIVKCGEGEARSAVLDVALIGAIRRGSARIARSFAVDYAAWTRAQADQIEREHRGVA